MSYWQGTLAARLPRRRALAIAGAGSAGAALLAACGGKNDGDSKGNKSSLLSSPVDTTKQAKRGGIFKRSWHEDPATLDAYGGGGTVAGLYEIAYSRLFAYKSGYLQPSQDEYEGALAESWEWSPDRLQLTGRLRQGVKFHNLPPVNGRLLDTQDILYSWKRFSEVGSNRRTVVNSANPDAPVISVTTPDARTVVVRFKEPLIYAQSYMTQRGYLSIVPREAEDTRALDLRQRMIGTGPFALIRYQPSVGMTFTRHPDYWDKSVYIEQIDYPIVTEYATAVSQLRTGNIYYYDSRGGVRQEDILPTKRDVPAIGLYPGELNIEGRRTTYGWQAVPLRDKRVRQALSMTMDRDSWIEAAYDTKSFISQGLPVETRWNTSLTATENSTGWWLDPRGKDFGKNAKYFEDNVAEAKKLLAAAGFASGVDITSNHFTTGEHGTDFVKLIDLFEGMAAEAGFRFKKNIIPYNQYLQSFRDANGAFDGVTYKSGPPAPSDDPVARLTYEYSSVGGIGFHGFDPDGKGDGSGDPYVESQLAKARVEFDAEKRRPIIHELQRYLAEQQYHLRWPGGAAGFELVWPAVRNFRVFRPGTQQANLVANTTWWIDETQPPFTKS